MRILGIRIQNSRKCKSCKDCLINSLYDKIIDNSKNNISPRIINHKNDKNIEYIKKNKEKNIINKLEDPIRDIY